VIALVWTDMDWPCERSVGRGMNCITFGQHMFTGLDYTGTVFLIAELLELLVTVLDFFSGGNYPTWTGNELAKDNGSLRLHDR